MRNSHGLVSVGTKAIWLGLGKDHGWSRGKETTLIIDITQEHTPIHPNLTLMWTLSL